MKTLLIILILSLLPISAQQSTQQKITTAYDLAIKEIENENFDKAEKYLTAILKADPKHGNARFQMINMKKYREAAEQSGSKKQVQGITISEINFEEITLSDAIEGFRILVDQSNGESPAPNIVVVDPQGKLEGNNISLTLSQVPADTALTFLADSAKARVNYSKDLIQLFPLN